MAKVLVTVEGKSFEVELDVLHLNGKAVPMVVDGEEVSVQVPGAHGSLADIDWIIVDDRPYEITFDDQLRWIRAYSGIYHIEVRDLEAAVARPRSRDGRIKAPIPGMVTRVLVNVGDEVDAGQPVVVLEAMKMENEIRAPLAGRVTAVHIQPQRTVIREEVMVEIS